MSFLSRLYESLETAYGTPALALAAAAVVLFIVQLCYWMRCYARIPSYRVDGGQERDTQRPPVSVIVVVQDDFTYLEETLPLILGQQYPEFEVVVVDLASAEEFSDALQALQEQNGCIQNEISQLCGIEPASTTAVFPTPGSPMSAGLFFVRRDKICSTRRISVSRPTTGSISPPRATSVMSFPY